MIIASVERLDAPVVGPTCLRLAPDGRSLAFALRESGGSYLDLATPLRHAIDFAGRARALDETAPVRERWASLERSWRIEALAWSPDGERLACSFDSDEPGAVDRAVAWVGRDELGSVPALEARRVPATAFAWAPAGKALVIADNQRRLLLRVPMDGSPAEPLGPLPVLDPLRPVRLSVSPDGSRLALACARRGVVDLWIVERDGTSSLLTQVPGFDVDVLPFWSPKGHSLGMLVIHADLDKSAIILVPQLRGDGVIVFEERALARFETPAWAPSTDSIVFLRGAPAEPLASQVGTHSLALADLAPAGYLYGSPRFLSPRTIAFDGAAAVYLVRLAEPL